MEAPGRAEERAEGRAAALAIEERDCGTRAALRPPGRSETRCLFPPTGCASPWVHGCAPPVATVRRPFGAKAAAVRKSAMPNPFSEQTCVARSTHKTQACEYADPWHPNSAKNVSCTPKVFVLKYRRGPQLRVWLGKEASTASTTSSGLMRVL